MADDPSSSGSSLRKSARASLVWGAGFTLARDVLQFAAMLVLVRLLTPVEYGTAALAQSIIGFLSAVSFGRLVLHALQLRDPMQIDWQAHFTAGTVVNVALFALTLVVAWWLTTSDRYASAAAPVAFLSLTFLVEVPSSLRNYMLQASHDWARARTLLILGTALSLASGLLLALAGAGIWALVVQPPLFGVPATVDLWLKARWRPDWSWSWSRYRDAARFGASRMAVAMATTGRALVEQAVMVASFDFAMLGVFTRSVGLAVMAAGRIGAVATSSLYPVLTRAQKGSPQFRRNCARVLAGVTWTTMAAAAVLIVTSADVVRLLYGPQWVAASALMPLVTLAVALGGIYTTSTTLLLANESVGANVALDIGAAAVGIAVAFLVVPMGLKPYLVALAAQALAMCVLSLGRLVASGGIDRSALVDIFLPAVTATGVGIAVPAALHEFVGTPHHFVLRMALDIVVILAVYVAVLRILFPRQLLEILDVLPGAQSTRRALRL